MDRESGESEQEPRSRPPAWGIEMAKTENRKPKTGRTQTENRKPPTPKASIQHVGFIKPLAYYTIHNNASRRKRNKKTEKLIRCETQKPKTESTITATVHFSRLRVTKGGLGSRSKF